MSGLVMGLVWELEFDKGSGFGRPEKYVLLAYADHSDQNGGGIWPSVDLVAKKTGYAERAVQLITRNLESEGYLVADGMGPNGTNRYRIPVVRTEGGAKIAPLPKRSPLEDKSTVKNVENCTPSMSEIAPEGIAPEEFAPEPSRVVKDQEEEEKIEFLNLPDGLEEKLTNFGIFRSVWPDVARRLAEGWTPEDLIALMAWMRETKGSKSRAAQGFASRVREKSKAPKDYYPRAAIYADADEEPEAEDMPALEESFLEGSEVPASTAWGQALRQVDLPQHIQGSVKSARPEFANGWLVVHLARGDGNVDWMASRLTRLVERSLVGVLNREIKVAFVAG